MSIPDEIVQDLIVLGDDGKPGIPQLLAEPEEASALLMRGVKPWYAVARQLDETSLRHLIKGLVLYSQASGWSGGSVSPVIQLYSVFAERFPDAELDLNRWIIENRSNSYEPFGSLFFDDASTLREHQSQWAAHRQEREAERTRREEDRLRNVAADATSKLPNAVRRGDVGAVQALIAKGADLTIKDASGATLVEIAESAGKEAILELLRNAGSTKQGHKCIVV